jgi:hypothetical protein
VDERGKGFKSRDGISLSLVPKSGSSCSKNNKVYAPLQEDVQLQFPSCYRAWSPIIGSFSSFYDTFVALSTPCTSVLFITFSTWSFRGTNSHTSLVSANIYFNLTLRTCLDMKIKPTIFQVSCQSFIWY